MEKRESSPRKKYIATCSGGKDSIATILLALEHGEPLDEVVWVEVMFNKELSGEVPEHRDFVYNKLKPFCEKNGIRFTILHSAKTYDDVFHQLFTRGKNVGQKYGFARPRGCFLNKELKLKPLNDYKRKQDTNVVWYIGIAADESKRLKRLDGVSKISLLSKYAVTEKDATQLCKERNLLSPIYEISRRNGCWFCPYAKDKELIHFLQHHEEMFDKLIEWEKEDNLSYRRMNFSEKPSEVKARLMTRIKLNDFQQFMQLTKEQGDLLN